MAIASVDGGLLLQVIWSSLVAGVFVTGLFSFVVVFSSRSVNIVRTERAALVVFGSAPRVEISLIFCSTAAASLFVALWAAGIATATKRPQVKSRERARRGMEPIVQDIFY